MRSVRQELRRLRRYALNRARPVGPRHGAVAVPGRFQPPSHRYADYAGPWIEETFLAFWRARRPTGIDRMYVPVFWTDYYLRHGRREPHPELQEFLDASLEPGRRYFTLVQNDDGVLERLTPNVLVFGAGAGDVPIPLLGRRPRAQASRRDILCSFMGSLGGASDRLEVRSRLAAALADRAGFHFGQGSYQDFVEVTSRSVFALCPRGYGPTSYRLYEALALGAVPVYVWAELEWLPWQDELDWDDLAVRVHIDDVARIPELLASRPPDRIGAMRQRVAAMFDDYFTLRGTCEQILARLTRSG